jgi:hypothetical protein
LLLAWFCIFPVCAKEAAPKDTFRIEVLSFDSAVYRKLKAQKKFNYYRSTNETNLLQKWKDDIYRWLRKHLKMKLTDKQFDRIMLFVLMLVLVSSVVFLYFYKPSLFYFNRKQKWKHFLEEENIEGHDFDYLIRQALEKGEYAEAIRLNYLKVLKLLNERELISFNPYKTVNEYVYELKRIDLKSDFKNLSRQFVYYRYGKRKASMEAFERFRELSHTIIHHFL